MMWEILVVLTEIQVFNPGAMVIQAAITKAKDLSYEEYANRRLPEDRSEWFQDFLQAGWEPSSTVISEYKIIGDINIAIVYEFSFKRRIEREAGEVR